LPCNTVQTSTVEFNAQSTSVSILSDALRALGLEVYQEDGAIGFSGGNGRGTYNAATGKLSLRSYGSLDAAAIKRAYSEQVVISQAKKFGWQLSWKVNASGNRQATVVKRA
jgi:hypothetical protein